jgi:Flp pilus assembly protein TadG
MLVLTTSIQKTWRRFWRARDGAVAMEFGFVVVPFFMLMIGVAEVSMVGFTQTNLDLAISEQSREIRTGTAQETGLTYTQIRTAICDDIQRLMVVDCEANLFLDVQTYASFVDAADGTTNPIVNGQLQSGGFGFSPGGASDIVVVRAYYRWHVLTPLFENIFANADGGDRLLVSTMMFRNEPF